MSSLRSLAAIPIGIYLSTSKYGLVGKLLPTLLLGNPLFTFCLLQLTPGQGGGGSRTVCKRISSMNAF